MLPQGPYNPSEHEDEIYKSWEEAGHFQPRDKQESDTKEDHFSIVMPPPNVTGVLHTGHALTIAIEDLMVRYNRMLGKRTVWIPGTDHAAIATQSKVEKMLYKEEKKRKQDLGREEFLKRVEAFAQNSHDTIVSQAKKMGASCDWTREAYTLDEARHKAVYTAFQKMYEDGLIYQGLKVVNWDPKGQTVISDDEVDHEERDAVLYTFKYSKDFPIAISTTRPETKLGDTAVAVHPDDERYQDLVGQEFDFEFCGEPVHVRIIADHEADPEFGTGALGVTPAHSQIDADMADRHGLPYKQVINEYARMTVGNENIKDKKVTEARAEVIKWLAENDLLISQEEVKQNVAVAERTGAIVEPLPKKQWFIDVNKKFTLADSKIDGIESGSQVTLKEMMRQVVENKQIKLIPERFDKTYFHWIDNLRDWCISRQIWYGHRIPVWYRGEEIYVGLEAPKGEGWEQDPDTLDTWFSSGLWTFSTLGWPDQTPDLADFHPTDVLETGSDIIFFWVARMILMSGYLLGEIPFSTVYFHGIIKGTDGTKMSKSKGNVIDPIETIEKYGTDALRMSLVFSAGQGNAIILSDDKIVAQKKFANKLWNASKFVMMNLDENVAKIDTTSLTFSQIDKDILEKLATTIKTVTDNFNKYMYHEAAQDLYHFFWHDFCDEYIEASKASLNGDDEGAKKATQFALYLVLKNSLKMLHPIMPYITELIYSELPKDKSETDEMLIVSKWPTPDEILNLINND